MNPRFESYGATHIGLVRERNEDSFGLDPSAGVYVVADGMGGHPDGDTASSLAVAAVLHTVQKQGAAELSETAQLQLVEQAIAAAHEQVTAANRDRSIEESMGSTIAVLLTVGADFVLGNVGDSKAYSVVRIYGSRHIMQLSADHNVASELIRRGAPPHLIVGGRTRSLTQAIGIGQSVRPKVVSGCFATDDCIVMCSDGATDYVTHTEFHKILMDHAETPRLLVSAVIDAALRGGGGDNCTCICVRRVR